MSSGDRPRPEARAPAGQKGFSLSFDNDLWEAGFTEVPNYFLQASNLTVEVRFACICILAHIRDRKARADEQEGTFIGLDTLAEKYGRSSRWWWQQVKELTERGILQRQPRGFGQTVRHKFVTDHQQWNLDPRPSAWPNHLYSLTGGRGTHDGAGESAPSSQASAKMPSSQASAKMDSFANACESSSQTPSRRYSQTPSKHIKDEEDAVGKKIQIEQDAVSSAACAAPVASASKNGAKRGERACATPQEQEQREALMQLFNDVLRPITLKEQARFRNEMLSGMREHGPEAMARTLEVMGTSREFVGKAWVSPVAVSKNVLLWQDAGCPARWDRVEEYRKRKIRQQGGREG